MSMVFFDLYSDETNQAREQLLKHHILVISGRSGIGKSHFALSLGEMVRPDLNAKLMGVTGDQFRQHAAYHPFERTNYLESLRKNRDSFIQAGATIAGTIIPTAQFFFPLYLAIKNWWKSHKSISSQFTQEEIEGARHFATKSNSTRIFIFDNFHFWDQKSLEFAQKVILTREHLNLYIILVWTEHDVVESVNPFYSIIKSIRSEARYCYKGLSREKLRDLFLVDIPSYLSEKILNHGRANIPLIKRLSKLALMYSQKTDIDDILENAAVDMKLESLMAIRSITPEQQALASLATLGSGTSLCDIACTLNININEASSVLNWGIYQELIDVLESQQVVFIHDLYQRIFDSTDIIDSTFLDRINLCCTLALPDEYEKRISIAIRGKDKDFILSLVLSHLRQNILSRNQGKNNIIQELQRIHSGMNGKYKTEIQEINHVLKKIIKKASCGDFIGAAWSVSFTNIISRPDVFVEEAIMFSHYAYLSRDNDLRKIAIEKLKSAQHIARNEAERSFILATMIAYGLSLENQLSEATAIFAKEESQLAASSDRFKSAYFYIAICERMSLACYDNAIARKRLERSFSTLENFFRANGYLKRPDEILKCATNLCSAYLIANMPEQANRILHSAKSIATKFDFSWSTVPAFLKNNEMVVDIHIGTKKLAVYATEWLKLAKYDSHLCLFFLVNSLACFLKAESPQLGNLNITTVISLLEKTLQSNKNIEYFIAYMAYFTIWQASHCLGIKCNQKQYIEIATAHVLNVPYVNGDYFRMRHQLLVSSLGDRQSISLDEWEKEAFTGIPKSTLPYFYQHVAHFNPLEFWLPF